MTLQIDGRQLLERALQEARPGEDFDEALLRACKALYPRQHMDAFSAAEQMLAAMQRGQSGTKLDVARRVTRSHGPVKISISASCVTATHTGQGANLEEALAQLPPGIRDRAREALASGRTSVKVSTRAASATAPAKQAPTPPRASRPAFTCKHCGFSDQGHFDRCPHCGRRQRGFLSRLFGR